jgi:hypothetical protein
VEVFNIPHRRRIERSSRSTGRIKPPRRRIWRRIGGHREEQGTGEHRVEQGSQSPEHE